MDKVGNVTVGIIGAGTMGIGVAQRLAQYGYQVILLDISEEILRKAKKVIGREILLHNLMAPEKLDTDKILGCISTTIEYSELSTCDVIIENVPERLEIKKQVYEKLEEVCKPECIYMVNTSCISITEVGSFTKRADKVIGVHFMNPVPVQNFSEVIRGYHTSEETCNKVEELLHSVKIDDTIINDSVGFVSNRLSHIFMNEAANLVLEGVATPEQIDMIFTEGFHHTMGPLHTADLIGLDTVKDSLEILYNNYQDPKYKCSPLLKKKVDAGLLGRKSKEGFFKY